MWSWSCPRHAARCGGTGPNSNALLAYLSRSDFHTLFLFMCWCFNSLSTFSCFQYLCECQFDDNLKFKNIINEEDADAMRLQPIGRDKDGLMYWYQLDQEHNVRMYIEEQDDQDGSTWKCIVRYSFFSPPLFFSPVFCCCWLGSEMYFNNSLFLTE